MSYNNEEEFEIKDTNEEDDFDFDGDLDEETFGSSDPFVGEEGDDAESDQDDFADLDGSEY